MVDSIGTKAVTAQDRLVVPVAAAAKPASTTAKPSEAASKELQFSAIAFDKPSAADEARVEEVRRAVRNGTYPITPETIADRMLALKLYWNPTK